MGTLSTYFAERFPLVLVAPLSLATASLILGLFDNQSVPVLGLMTLTFLCFMLRMRVTDEFKDSAHDNQNYPNRPVQRGLISKSQLLGLGVTASFIELLCVVGLAFLVDNLLGSIWYGLIVLYSLLTRFEFFAKEFLAKHFNIYLITHQAIFLLYPIWLNNLFKVSFDQKLLFGWSSFVLLMALMEIVRKYELRFDAVGNLVLDTYLAVWKHKTIWVIVALVALSSTLLYLSRGQPIIAIVGILVVITLIAFRNANETVRLVAALFFILESALCLIL
ncbi:MAG: hypothetical protein ACKOFA_05285 [Rhodoluna sp.]